MNWLWLTDRKRSSPVYSVAAFSMWQVRNSCPATDRKIIAERPACVFQRLQRNRKGSIYVYLVHDILRGCPKLLPSTVYPPSALECNYAWHRNQNKLDLKEKGSSKWKKETEKKKKQAKEETGSPNSFKVSYIAESELAALSQEKELDHWVASLKGQTAFFYNLFHISRKSVKLFNWS